MRALIASGTGRYADPWHPFPRTSPRLAEILGEAGFEVTIDDDVDAAMQRLTDVDLLVVNAGDPWRNADTSPAPPAASVEGLRAALERGIGVIALHCAVASLRDYPAWAPAIGGMWVPGASFHPPADEASITGLALPEGEAIEDFTLFDERYCRLQQFGDRTVVATHAGPDGTEPTAWVRTAGPARIAVDTLGHDERSYDSAGHRALVTALARWATGA